MGRLGNRRRDDEPDGREHCRMCGTRVPVGPDGRCRLGHRVRAAGAAPQTTAPTAVQAGQTASEEGHHAAPVEDHPAAVAEDHLSALLEDHPAAVAEDHLSALLEEHPAAVEEDHPAALLEDYPAAVAEEDPADVLAGPAPAALPVDTAARHPYDEVLAPGPHPVQVAASRTATGEETRSVLEDLLLADEPMQSALDVSVEELPAPPPPAPAEPDAEAGPAPVDATSDADGDADDGPEQTTRRRLAVLLGSGALALLGLAIVALASTL